MGAFAADAVTVTTVVVGWVMLDAAPDPHAAVTSSVASTRNASVYFSIPARVLLLAAPRLATPREIAKMYRATNGDLENGPLGRFCAPVAPGACTANVVETADEVGATLCGLKAQLPPAGRPEQARASACLKPFCGVTVTVRVPDPPGCTVRDELLKDSE